MPTAIDKIVDRFPFPTIPLIVGTPTYNTIADVNLKLNSNSASVQSTLGCGTLGLQLTVSPAVYNTLSVTPFVGAVVLVEECGGGVERIAKFGDLGASGVGWDDGYRAGVDGHNKRGDR